MLPGQVAKILKDLLGRSEKDPAWHITHHSNIEDSNNALLQSLYLYREYHTRKSVPIFQASIGDSEASLSVMMLSVLGFDFCRATRPADLLCDREGESAVPGGPRSSLPDWL